LAALGLIGAFSGPRYDAIVAPSGDLVAVRGADGLLRVVGKRFNAFTTEQWLAADGDDREPASARDERSPCDRDGCIGALASGGRVSLVIQTPAFEEDCVRAAVLVSALNAPADCPAQVFDQHRLARTGAVGLTWDGSRFLVATDRSSLEDRPWSPLPWPAPDERVVAPAPTVTSGADPADP
jgi:competence protein ComEC